MDILNVFFQSQTPKPPVEIVLLEELRTRKLEYALSEPQRLHFYLIILLTKGTCLHTIDFVQYECKAQDMLFIAPHQVQQFDITSASKGFLLLFDASFFAYNPYETQFLHQSLIFDTQAQNHLICLEKEDYRNFMGGLHMMQKELASETDWATEELLKKHLSLFLFYAERLKRKQAPAKTTHHYQLEFQAFKQTLETHYKQQKNVDFYAQSLHTSPKTLNRVCLACSHKTAKQFIAERVLLEAKRLLAHTAQPIKEIAYELGFEEVSNFTKYFRKMANLTPLAFRNKFV